MGYIEDNLLPGETVLLRGKHHRYALFGPLLFVAGLIFAMLIMLSIMGSNAGGLAKTIAMLGLILLAIAFLGAAIGTVGAVASYFGDEVAVTNQRVIGKLGLIRRQTLELPFHQIESLALDQGIIYRMLGGASIRCLGSGSAWVSTPVLSNYKVFRSTALEQMEKTRLERRPVG